MILPERKIWALYRMVSELLLSPKEGSCRMKWTFYEKWYLPERKGWALYLRVSKLLLSLKEGWRRMKWKLYAEVQHLKKRESSWDEGWALYRRMSELMLSPKERWCREWEEYLQDRQRKVLFPLLVRFTFEWILLFSFSCCLHGIHDINATGNTRTMQCG